MGGVLFVTADVGDDVVYKRRRIEAKHEYTRASYPFAGHMLYSTG
jgi:hypothetical protein